jgi:hypothetical protein
VLSDRTKTEEVIGCWRKLQDDEFDSLYSLPKNVLLG